MHDSHPIATKIAIGIAGGVLAWGGANISSNSKATAVQQEQIRSQAEQQAALTEKIDGIYESVHAIRLDVAIVKERTETLLHSNGEKSPEPND